MSDKEERKKYLKELGIENPKKVQEHDSGEEDVTVIEEEDGEKEKKEKRKEEELEQYRETSGF